MPGIGWAVVAVVFIFIVFFLIIAGQFISLWVQAWLSGAYVGFTQLIGMRLRKVDIRTIVISRIRAVKAGIEISADQLESHFLAGGRVPNVVSAMIAAQNAGIELPWNVSTAIDLAGRDIL